MGDVKPELYWYFAATDRRLRYSDGRAIVLGETHKVDCEPQLCEWGLHASERIIDALSFAPGPVVYRVKLGGTVVHGDDKSVATERTYVSGGIDISDTLRAFARKCALDVIHLWDAPRIVRQYLETGDESIRAAAWAAASAAAWAAARAAAWDAARAAARAAAWDAASAAARAAARAAAWDAAWDAARAAARAAASAAQNETLEKMVSDAIRVVPPKRRAKKGRK